MAEDIKTKLEGYRTAPFDARFPNQNQTRNCWSNYLGKAARQGQSRQLCSAHNQLLWLFKQLLNIKKIHLILSDVPNIF